MFDRNKESAEKLHEHYPSFQPIAVPGIRGAHRAWQGRLRPLSLSAEIGPIVTDLENGNIVHILRGGTLHHAPDCKHIHEELWYAAALQQGMGIAFTVTLVDFGSTRHPQIFSSNPLISAGVFPAHPHLRQDQIASIDGKLAHGLCTYLASDGVLDRGPMSLVQVLDFTSIFLAKHLIWERTARLLFRQLDHAPKAIAADPSGIMLRLKPIPTTAGTRWEGHWPGPQAPHRPQELLATISPDAECPCGLGNVYAKCCRDKHIIFRDQSEALAASTLA